MSIFYLGLVLFFVPHFYSALRSRAEGRDIRVKMGERKYMGLYSLVTAAGLGLIIWGYIKSPSGEFLYSGPHAIHHYAWIIMLPAMILLASAYAPLGHIKRFVQHPMMLAVLIWALTHLAIGGDEKRVLLFGLFALYALVSLICAYRRGTRLKEKSPNIIGDVISLVVGFALTGVLLHGGHQAVFGAAPL